MTAATRHARQAAALVSREGEAVILPTGTVTGIVFLPAEPVELRSRGSDTGARLAIDQQAIPVLYLRTEDAGARPATAASRTTGTVAADNALAWTAAELGTEGNSLSIWLQDPGAPDAPLGFAVDGNTLVVSLATDGAGAIITTAADLLAAAAADDDVLALVSVASVSGSDGSGVVSAMVAALVLTGGTDAALIEGAAVTLRGIEYLVVRLDPDGEGMTRIELMRPGAEIGPQPTWNQWR